MPNQRYYFTHADGRVCLFQIDWGIHPDEKATGPRMKALCGEHLGYFWERLQLKEPVKTVTCLGCLAAV